VPVGAALCHDKVDQFVKPFPDCCLSSRRSGRRRCCSRRRCQIYVSLEGAVDRGVGPVSIDHEEPLFVLKTTAPPPRETSLPTAQSLRVFRGGIAQDQRAVVRDPLRGRITIAYFVPAATVVGAAKFAEYQVCVPLVSVKVA
jgi:hypothetical protein